MQTPPPLWTEWHTGVKTLPCPQLRLRAIKIALHRNNVDKLISVWTSGYQKSLVHLTNACNSFPQEWIPVGYVPPALYRTGGGVTVQWGGGLWPGRGVCVRETPLPSCGQTDTCEIITLPQTSFAGGKISGIAVVSCLRCMTTVKCLTNPSVLRRICL